MKTPDEIKADEPRFKPNAWHGYTVAELAMWSHLLRKRADMRAEPEKAAKDRTDADAYEVMLREMLA